VAKKRKPLSGWEKNASGTWYLEIGSFTACIYNGKLRVEGKTRKLTSRVKAEDRMLQMLRIAEVQLASRIQRMQQHDEEA